MRHIRLEVREYEQTGLIGFVPKIFSNWAETSYLPSTQLGHDLVAHGRFERGTTENELKALGAECWISNFYSLYNVSGYNRNESNFAGNLDNTFRDQMFDLSNMTQTKKYPRFKELYQLKTFFDKAWEILFTSHLDIDDSLAISDYKQQVFDWIAYGFWYASRKRYSGYDSYDIYTVRDRINQVGKQLRLDDSYIGREFTLSYDLSGYAEIKPIGKFYE